MQKKVLVAKLAYLNYLQIVADATLQIWKKNIDSNIFTSVFLGGIYSQFNGSISMQFND